MIPDGEMINDEQLDRLKKIMELPIEQAAELTDDELTVSDRDHNDEDVLNKCRGSEADLKTL